MSVQPHDHSSLGAYALGALSHADSMAVEAHLASCPDGRREMADLAQLRRAMDEVPPEAFIEGPPPGGELLLQRTLRRVRTEETRPRRALMAAGVVVLIAVTLGAGILVGRETVTVAEAPPPSAGVVVDATDGSTGAKMAVRVTPATGWVRVNVKVEGVRAGEQCQIVVVSKSGVPVIAGSWLVSPKGEKEGTSLDGSALVAPTDVRSVDVVTTDGRKIVSVPV